MSQFEFVFVIASIVVALSLTRLFDGLGQTLQKKMSGGPVDRYSSVDIWRICNGIDTGCVVGSVPMEKRDGLEFPEISDHYNVHGKLLGVGVSTLSQKI